MSQTAPKTSGSIDLNRLIGFVPRVKDIEDELELLLEQINSEDEGGIVNKDLFKVEFFALVQRLSSYFREENVFDMIICDRIN
jgi:hypothetical protein